MHTVPDLIEAALDYAMRAAEHRHAYEAALARDRPAPRRRLARQAHFFASLYLEAAADTAWRCLRHADAVPA